MASIFFTLSAVKTYDISGCLQSFSLSIPITISSLSNKTFLQNVKYKQVMKNTTRLTDY